VKTGNGKSRNVEGYSFIGTQCLIGFWYHPDMVSKDFETNTIITCPKCGYKVTEKMPTDYCQHSYDCKECGETLKPKRGDCCVFCSYGTVPCPPIQL